VRTNRVVRWRERSAAQASGPSVPLSSRQPADSVVGRTPDSTHVTVVSSRSQHRPVYDRELDCIRPMLATTEVPNTLSFSASLFGCIFLFFFAFLLSASARFIWFIICAKLLLFVLLYLLSGIRRNTWNSCRNEQKTSRNISSIINCNLMAIYFNIFWYQHSEHKWPSNDHSSSTVSALPAKTAKVGMLTLWLMWCLSWLLSESELVSFQAAQFRIHLLLFVCLHVSGSSQDVWHCNNWFQSWSRQSDASWWQVKTVYYVCSCWRLYGLHSLLCCVETGQ